MLSRIDFFPVTELNEDEVLLEKSNQQHWQPILIIYYFQINEECSIYLETGHIRALSCCHFYHELCIARWALERQSQSDTGATITCPLCRKQIISAIYSQ